MASPTELDDLNSGQRVAFSTTGGDTLEVDLFVRPGGYARAHAHPSQEETFSGVSGTFVLEVGGQTRTIGPGESVTVPAGTRHGFGPAGEEAQLRVTVRPPLRLEGCWRAFLGLGRDGKLRTPLGGLPRPFLQFAVVMDRYQAEMAAPGFPLALQRLLWRLLASLGRRRGYRDSFPEYGAA